MAKYKIIPSSRTIVRSPISIGHKAEKGVEAIEFDLTAWVGTYGSGTATVIMRRWGDAIPYPIALEIDENNKATWTLSDIDTARAGMAYAQLSYIVGETVVKKSDIYTFRVMDSLTGEGEPPEAYESWLEHLTHLAAEAMAEVLDIEGIVTDKTLTVDGGVADAKKTGDEISGIKADLEDLDERVEALESGSGGSGLTDAVKTALLQLAQKVAYIDDDGQDYYDDLYDALYPPAPPASLTSITAIYTQSGTVYDTDSLNDLKSDLVVTAHYSDSTTGVVTGYTLSGTLAAGTSTITVTYSGKTTTFTVTVSQYDGSIYNWDFTQSLVDSKQSATATLGSGVTRGASGLTFDGTTNAYVHLADMSNYATSSFTVEVDVDTLVSGGTLIDLNTQSGMSDNPCGLIFSGHWYFRLTSNSNATIADSTLTDPTIFNGHTVKCQFDYTNKTWTVYNNGTLVGSVTAYQKSNGRNQLGLSANYSSRYVGNGTVIKAVRVYEGVV